MTTGNEYHGPVSPESHWDQVLEAAFRFTLGPSYEVSLTPVTGVESQHDAVGVDIDTKATLQPLRHTEDNNPGYCY